MNGERPKHERYAGEGMLLGTFPTTPREIIYTQIGRILESHSRGSDAAEELAGLMALLTPWKDGPWNLEMERIRKEDSKQQENGDIVWDILSATVMLLSRRNMWAVTPRSPPVGTEFSEAI